MDFRFEVNITVNRTTGKFATRDEILEVIVEALNDANPDTIYTDEQAEYEVENWEAEEVKIPKVKKQPQSTFGIGLTKVEAERQGGESNGN